jgi:hypothetical protein
VCEVDPVHVREVINTYRIFGGRSVGKDCLGGVRVDKRIILKWIIQKV